MREWKRFEKSAMCSAPRTPRKRRPGSIRREFGQTIMVNAAHASDSEENAPRELGIIRVGENNFRHVVEEFYGKS